MGSLIRETAPHYQLGVTFTLDAIPSDQHCWRPWMSKSSILPSLSDHHDVNRMG